MTEEKKHDDKDRKKASDEEMEDVAGGIDAQGTYYFNVHEANKKPVDGSGTPPVKGNRKGKKKDGGSNFHTGLPLSGVVD